MAHPFCHMTSITQSIVVMLVKDVAGSSTTAKLWAISEAISFKSRSMLIKHRAIAQRIDAWAKKKRELGENLGENVMDKKVALVGRILGSR
jgi:hypothetical protein